MDPNGYRTKCLSFSKDYFGNFENFNLKLDNEAQIWILIMDPDPKLSQIWKMNLISTKF